MLKAIFSLLSAAWVAVLFPCPVGATDGAAGGAKVLLYDYSVTGGNVRARAHLREAMARIAAAKGFDLVTVGKKTGFSEAQLREYAVVVLSNGDGNVFPQGNSEEALKRYVGNGGGLVAVHAAGVFVTDFPFVSGIVGVRYYNRTVPGVAVEARVYSETDDLTEAEQATLFKGLPPEARLRDNWLTFASSPRKQPGVKVLLTLDETSFEGGNRMKDHPVVWARDVGEGRAVYNSLGGQDIYTQSGAFGERLLANLLDYASGGGPAGVQSLPPANALRLRVTGQRVSVSLPAGAHTFQITGVNGREVVFRKFQGPGEFTLTVREKGLFLARTQGTSGSLEKKFSIE